MIRKKCTLLAVIFAITFSAYSQTTEKAPRGAVKFGFEINPIVNISALKNIQGSTVTWDEFGSMFNGAMYVNRLTTVFGLGFVTNGVKSKTNTNTYQQRYNSLVGQLAIFKRYIHLDIFKESSLTIGIGGIGIFQVGNQVSENVNVEKVSRGFNSITLAPAARTQLVITEHLSVHTQLGLGVSLNHQNTEGAGRTSFRFGPLQSTNLLGQTGIAYHF